MKGKQQSNSAICWRDDIISGGNFERMTSHLVEILEGIITFNTCCYCCNWGIIGERARHYQGCTNSSWCGTYVWRYVKHNSSACHIYTMCAELGHSHFLYVPAVSSVVTKGNGTGTKNVLMEPCAIVCVSALLL